MKKKRKRREAVPVIYKLTSPIGKLYVGRTVDIKDRLNQHRNRAYNKKYNEYRLPIGRAIRKYGWERMKIEILCYCTLETMKKEEVRYIKDLNCRVPYGYNLESEASDGKHYYSKHPLTIKKLKKHHVPYFLGKTGALHPNSKPVLQIDKTTGQIIKEWECIAEVERKLGICGSGIGNVCNKKVVVVNAQGRKIVCKQAGGFIWIYKNDYSKKEVKRRLDVIKTMFLGRSQVVLQIDKNTGKIIKRWVSASAVKRELGISDSNIASAIHETNRMKSARGFIWVHEQDYSKKDINRRLKELKNPKRNSKVVLQINKDTGRILQRYSSLKKMEQITGIDCATVSLACKNKPCTNYSGYTYIPKVVGGFLWLFEKDFSKKLLQERLTASKNRNPVFQIDKDTDKIITKWGSPTEASLALGVCFKGISACCCGTIKTAFGFRWEYEKDFNKQN